MAIRYNQDIPETPVSHEASASHRTVTPAERGALARANFLKGYGCAQAVLLAFSDVTGWDDRTAARVGSSFGGGMGRMREVCGTVSGALMVAGLVLGYDDPTHVAEKNAHYARVRTFADRFKQACGKDTIICRQLLEGVPHTDGGTAEERTQTYYQKRPCPDLCALAAEILAHMIEEEKSAQASAE